MLELCEHECIRIEQREAFGIAQSFCLWIFGPSSVGYNHEHAGLIGYNTLRIYGRFVTSLDVPKSAELATGPTTLDSFGMQYKLQDESKG